MTRVIVVGARSARQGTGPFVAAALHKLGAEVCAIVGTADATIGEAKDALAANYGIGARGYTDLDAAIVAEQPQAVAICSPFRFHAAQLARVAAHGCHCLVEKPLAWPAPESEITALVGRYAERGLLLQQVNQWPRSLDAFSALHGALPEPIERFIMRLSPLSIGSTMVPDSAPHFIGMLQALLGPGECERVRIRLDGADGELPSRMTLDSEYHHSSGRCAAQLLLETCAERPRPTWYQINALRVDRAIELPAYTQYLTAGGRKQRLEDPMECVVADFLNALASGAATDTASLIQSHRNLTRLTQALPEQL